MSSKKPSPVTYEQQKDVADSRMVRWTIALSDVVVPLLRPILRPILRMPWLRRRLDNLLMGRFLEAWRLLEKGSFAQAFAIARAGAEESRGPQRPYPFAPKEPQEALWWGFLKLAATAAAQLGQAERAQVEALLESTPSPGGLAEAESLCTVARWRWSAGDRDGAFGLARRAVLADATWPSGHVLLAWLGLMTGKLDPLPSLREAIRLSPPTLATIEADPQFSKHPDLIASLHSGLPN
ncbi:MAG TPA: hypothetical protein VE964_10430 [Myxococcales bacterium]|nr:hypothetical protein [Myxococcales bacterium]